MRILMTVDEAKALVKSRLSEKRYKHTINVKKMAVKLAKRYGADEETARKNCPRQRYCRFLLTML